MTLVNLPQPHGQTIKQKYEYAKFLMLCKEPTLDVLKFFDKEQGNISYKTETCPDSPVPDYVLVWEKGDLFEPISMGVGYYSYLGYGGYNPISYKGFEKWANWYELTLLYAAVDKLIELSGERSAEKEKQESLARNEAERFLVKTWLEVHEED